LKRADPQGSRGRTGVLRIKKVADAVAELVKEGH